MSGLYIFVMLNRQCVLPTVKGHSKESALASALGEFIERLNCNFFYNDQFWGEDIANAEFVHYPDEKWFKPGPKVNYQKKFG
jgi:ribosomal protein S12 methylthiotransferase accessory factor